MVRHPIRGAARSASALLALALMLAGCPEASGSGSSGTPPAASESAQAERAPADPDAPEAETSGEPAPVPPSDPSLDAEWPLHGLVTGVQINVRESPEPDARSVGVLRIGSRIRLRDDRRPTNTCATGWYPVYPRGYACAGQGIEVGPEPPESTIAVEPPARDDPLPYAYYYVNQKLTAEYHRPPTREEQRATWAFARRYDDLLQHDEARAARLMEEGLPGEPEKPAVVRRYMDRGFYVAIPPAEAAKDSEFVRTVRGSYIWRARLSPRTGSDFEGIELTPERTLPVAWMRRTARPRHQRPRSDGTMRWAEDPEQEPLERQTVVEGWLRRERFGERVMHVLEGDRYFLSWFIGVAERVEPEVENRFDFADDEIWVHVDLSEQTLVVYRGHTPIFTTLVSSGMEGHETPVGYFRIQRKRISDTMANLGPDAGDERYRIEDVPWTQYFEGNVALHGAFWHDRFGLERSHGCVNLSPRDAHRLFELTLPHVPPGWHGVEADRATPGSRVIVTR